jgi:formylmethanofuran dehydrogenase subunit D
MGTWLSDRAGTEKSGDMVAAVSVPRGTYANKAMANQTEGTRIR